MIDFSAGLEKKIALVYSIKNGPLAQLDRAAAS